jgi:tetratricopeptide (TPR) repeat protein
MARFIICAIILFGFVSNLVGQDSLVHLNEVSFSSSYEKQLFFDFAKKKNKELLLPFFLTTSSTSTSETTSKISSQLSALADKLQTDGLSKKKNEKKVKTVYNEVHSTFLKKYQEEVRFNDIFLNGNYNCVTATALYALVFDKLGISYEVKEEPTHVYLLAYPNAENILVESTSPLSGFLSFDDTFKKNFIEALKNQKIIGSSELTNKSTDELFNTYYFKRDKLDLQQLIGIHYCNDALFKRDKNDIKGAFQQMEKAYLFYKAPKTEYLLMHFGTELISKEKLQPKEKSLLISKIARYKDQGITNEMIKGEFINLTNDLLSRDNNKSLYKECYQIIYKGITDPELLSEISYIYYYENGRILYNQGNFSPAKPFFEKALFYQPNNADLAGIFTTTIANSLRNERNVKVISDSLDNYKKKYPSLSENNNFNAMMVMSYAMRFGDAYQKGDAAEGDKFKTLFEEMIKSNKDLPITPSVVGSAYSAASSYFFKKGQKSKAKQLLEKGLEISPDNYELRVRQQMINGNN